MERLAIEGGTPVRETLLPYGRQQIDEADKRAVLDVLDSDFITQGPRIAAFEEALAASAGVRYCVAFANGTAALHAACHAAGIGPGDEAITTPMTFAASSNCVLYAGGEPRFADIDPRTYNLDPWQAAAAITSRTKALIPVDYTGQPAELDRFMALARERGLTVIEDAAHSLGATYGGRPVGSLADMTMFSFHPVKHITTGEGGAIVTNNEGFYDSLRRFRTHGIVKEFASLPEEEGPWYYEMRELGYNYRITDLQAALGLSQLKKLPAFVARRREIAEAYSQAFRELDGLITPYQHPAANSSWHLYVLRFERAKFKAGRKAIFQALRQENIGVQVHYIPVHRHPYYRGLGYPQQLCPEAGRLYEEMLSLPIFPGMTDRDVADVVRAVRKIHHFYAVP